jgi:hypothetical protein
LPHIDPDVQKQRLENMIRDGIEPRIPGVSIRPIPLRTGGVVMAIRIPRSWALPHVVKIEGHWRFYSRNSAGKYPLDVSEVRAAFALSETAADRIRKFRAERLSMIIAGETPVELPSWPKIVLHLVPLNAFDPAVKFDVNSLANNVADLAPIYAHGWTYRHNFDGLLTYTQPQTDVKLTYLQIFRTGTLEAVESMMLRPQDDRRTIPSFTFEQQLIHALPRFLSIQKRLGVEPPVLIMLTLLGVAGYTMGVQPSLADSLDIYPID